MKNASFSRIKKNTPDAEEIHWKLRVSRLGSFSKQANGGGLHTFPFLGFGWSSRSHAHTHIHTHTVKKKRWNPLLSSRRNAATPFHARQINKNISVQQDVKEHNSPQHQGLPIKALFSPFYSAFCSFVTLNSFPSSLVSSSSLPPTLHLGNTHTCTRTHTNELLGKIYTAPRGEHGWQFDFETGCSLEEFKLQVGLIPHPHPTSISHLHGSCFFLSLFFFLSFFF